MFFFNLADFVVQDEDAPSIYEALKILRKWNPAWKPPFFMTDYDFREINAIESCNILFCEFNYFFLTHSLKMI